MPVRWREAGQAHGSGGAGPSATDDAAGSGAARTDPVPVPGYSTVFPLYQRVQYAMPGERTEAY